MAALYLGSNDALRALAKLQLCFKVDPNDFEIVTTLARAFHELGQTSKTLSVYRELARLHAEAGRENDEREVWEKVLELAPDDETARACAAPL